MNRTSSTPSIKRRLRLETCEERRLLSATPSDTGLPPEPLLVAWTPITAAVSSNAPGSYDFTSFDAADTLSFSDANPGLTAVDRATDLTELAVVPSDSTLSSGVRDSSVPETFSNPRVPLNPAVDLGAAGTAQGGGLDVVFSGHFNWDLTLPVETLDATPDTDLRVEPAERPAPAIDNAFGPSVDERPPAADTTTDQRVEVSPPRADAVDPGDSLPEAETHDDASGVEIHVVDAESASPDEFAPAAAESRLRPPARLARVPWMEATPPGGEQPGSGAIDLALVLLTSADSPARSASSVPTPTPVLPAQDPSLAIESWVRALPESGSLPENNGLPRERGQGGSPAIGMTPMNPHSHPVSTVKGDHERVSVDSGDAGVAGPVAEIKRGRGFGAAVITSVLGGALVWWSPRPRGSRGCEAVEKPRRDPNSRP